MAGDVAAVEGDEIAGRRAGDAQYARPGVAGQPGGGGDPPLDPTQLDGVDHWSRVTWTAALLYDGWRDWASKDGCVNWFVAASCIGRKTWPGATVGVTQARARMAPRADRTVVQSPCSNPRVA